MRNHVSFFLLDFVRYHVVPGVWYSEGLVDGQYLTTLYDKELKVSVSTDGLTSKAFNAYSSTRSFS